MFKITVNNQNFDLSALKETFWSGIKKLTSNEIIIIGISCKFCLLGFFFISKTYGHENLTM